MALRSFSTLSAVLIAFMSVGCDGGPAQPSTANQATTLNVADLAKPISFAGTNASPVIASLRGFAQAEPFGRWTNAKIASVEFGGPLPPRFELELSAAAIGPNIGADTTIAIGPKSYSIKILGDLSDFRTYTLTVENPTNERTISIIVPKPISPEELGKGSDSRSLGIAVGALMVRPIVKPTTEKK